MAHSILIFHTPIGWLQLFSADGKAIHALDFLDTVEHVDSAAPYPVLTTCKQELLEYFGGKRTTFSVPLEPRGTAFQQRVWKALQDIPYGITVSYGDVAKSINHEKASRAVGMANNRNPIPIMIPCHRVVGSKGDLVGYGGGLDIKKYLIELEQK